MLSGGGDGSRVTGKKASIKILCFDICQCENTRYFGTMGKNVAVFAVTKPRYFKPKP